jgi:hypothetical protein
MKERLDTKLNGEYAKFTRLEWRGEDVNDMRQAPARSEEEWTAFTNSKRVGRKTVTGGRGPVDLAETPLRNPFDGQEYIYLSADADYELETLKENETYIIGGIVDRNRYKVSLDISAQDTLLGKESNHSSGDRICVRIKRRRWALKQLACLLESTSPICRPEKS